MHKPLIFAMLLVPLASCSAFYKVAVGIEEPKAHPDNTQLVTYAKNTYPKYPFYRVSKDYFPILLKNKYKPDWEPGFRPIQFLCFDKNGKLITQWASCESELTKFVLADSIPKSKYKSFENITLEETYSHFQDNSGKALEPSQYRGNDITYIVYWTVWTDRQSKKLVEELEQYTKKTKVKSEIVLVNADYYSLPIQ